MLPRTTPVEAKPAIAKFDNLTPTTMGVLAPDQRQYSRLFDMLAVNDVIPGHTMFTLFERAHISGLLSLSLFSCWFFPRGKSM